MARRQHHRRKTLPTIWRCPDELWERFELVLDELDPPAATGRKRIDQRKALDGMIHQARTGCQWRAIPRQFGDYRSIHRTMQRWIARGVFELTWSMLAAECDELGGVNFDWQAADCSMGKARQGGATSVRTPRIAGKTAQNAA
jgi:putative transposase